MRVLQLAARMMSLERFALPLMQRLRDDGFDIEAMGGFDGSEDHVREAGFVVYDWNAGHSLNPLRIMGARQRLRGFLRAQTFDIVHSHCSFGGIIGNAVATKSGPHVIYTQHGFYVHDGLGPLTRRAWLRLEKTGLQPADHVLCVSRAEQELAQTLGVGPPAKFIHIPGAGIDISQFDLAEDSRLAQRQAIRDSLDIGQDDTVLLTVSRLTHDKGYREMIKASRMLLDGGHRFVFLAAGSGKDESAIRRAIEQAGVERAFRLLGWRDDVPNLYSAADIFVFASHREGLPISPIEAMASGLPVVLSDIPGCREEVEDGKSGLIFRTRDAKALAGCLTELLAEPERRRQLGAAARRRAEAFDIGKVLERQVNLYREIAGQS